MASFPSSSSTSLLRPGRPRQPGLSAPAFAGPQAPGRAALSSSGRCRRACDGGDRTAGRGLRIGLGHLLANLTWVKYLMFWSFGDLIGKMETIIHTKKGFKNSVRMYGAHAASRLGRIPPSHWRPLLFGFFQVLQAAPLPVGPCRTLPFGHLLTAFFGDPGCNCFPSR